VNGWTFLHEIILDIWHSFFIHWEIIEETGVLFPRDFPGGGTKKKTACWRQGLGMARAISEHAVHAGIVTARCFGYQK